LFLPRAWLKVVNRIVLLTSYMLSIAIKTLCEWQDVIRRMSVVLTADTSSGHRVAVALEAVPEESTVPYLSYTVIQTPILLFKFAYFFQTPLSLKIIEVRSFYLCTILF
jgi:hypothetical protein